MLRRRRKRTNRDYNFIQIDKEEEEKPKNIQYKTSSIGKISSFEKIMFF